MKQKLLLWIVCLFGLGMWFSAVIVYKARYYKPSEIKQDQPKEEQTALQNQTFQTPFVEKKIDEFVLTGVRFYVDKIGREQHLGEILLNQAIRSDYYKSYRDLKIKTKCRFTANADICPIYAAEEHNHCTICWPLTGYQFSYHIPEYGITLAQPNINETSWDYAPGWEEGRSWTGRWDAFYFSWNKIYPIGDVTQFVGEKYYPKNQSMQTFDTDAIIKDGSYLQYAPNDNLLSFSDWMKLYFQNFIESLVEYDCTQAGITGADIKCYSLLLVGDRQPELLIYNTKGYNSFIFYNFLQQSFWGHACPCQFGKINIETKIK